MSKIAVPVMRSIVTDDEFGGFRITIRPSLRRAVAFWCGLAVWTCGVLFTVRSIVSSPSRLTFEAITPLLYWLAAGVFISLFALLNGIVREVIKIDGKRLVLRKELGLFTTERAFELADIRNRRPWRFNDDSGGSRPPDRVAFDHKRRTFHFGASLSEQEVLRLIKTIQTKVSIREDWNEVEPLPVVR
jgi:hypothetical protein